MIKNELKTAESVFKAISNGLTLNQTRERLQLQGCSLQYVSSLFNKHHARIKYEQEIEIIKNELQKSFSNFNEENYKTLYKPVEDEYYTVTKRSKV
jgi:hypothetical protein